MQPKLFVIGVLNRIYRRTKTFLLNRNPPVLTRLFFGMIPLLDKLLSPRKANAGDDAATAAFKQQYAERIASDPDLRLHVETEHPVAITSDDHIHPRGAQFDNSANPAFNKRVYDLLGHPPKARFLDLGCSGGALVRSFLEDGHVAVGVEGSDISKRLRSGEWGVIPQSLFTADITRPFSVVDEERKPVLFDVITAWEVLEHIPEEVLDGLLSNIARHSHAGSYFIGSVDMLPDGNPLLGVVYHRTLKPRDWWEGRFRAWGFEPVAKHSFVRQDMVRGNGLSLKDWRPEDGTGFHLILQKSS